MVSQVESCATDAAGGYADCDTTAAGALGTTGLDVVAPEEPS